MVQLPGIVSFGYVIFVFLSVYFTADVKHFLLNLMKVIETYHSPYTRQSVGKP